MAECEYCESEDRNECRCPQPCVNCNEGQHPDDWCEWSERPTRCFEYNEKYTEVLEIIRDWVATEMSQATLPQKIIDALAFTKDGNHG